jgi:hypothetical protein
VTKTAKTTPQTYMKSVHLTVLESKTRRKQKVAKPYLGNFVQARREIFSEMWRIAHLNFKICKSRRAFSYRRTVLTLAGLQRVRLV